MSAEAPSLTVVVPARDAERTIARALASLANQARGDELEVVVVDDGSRDGTAEAARAYDDSNVRVVSGPGRGAAAARNIGLEVARGAWVALLDADDRWLPGHLDALRSVLEGARDAVACFGAARHVDESGRLIRVFRTPREHAGLEGLLRRRLQPTTSATAVRRDVALALGGFDEGFRRPAGVEDLDLWWRLAREGPCVVQPEPLTEYVVHLSRDTNRTRRELLDLRADRERCIERLEGAVGDRLFRIAAAQHYSVLVRYWLLAGYREEAQLDARRALAHAVTADGLAAFALSSLPHPLARAARRTRRVVSRVGRRR